MGATESKESTLQERMGYRAPENDYQLVFEAIKDLEHTLMTHFDGNGDHLHEMISTANQKFPTDLVVDMRALATVRNNMAHEFSFDRLPDRDAFVARYLDCVVRLQGEIDRRRAEEEQFFRRVVEKHRQMHPRPSIVSVEEESSSIAGTEAPPRFACVACF